MSEGLEVEVEARAGGFRLDVAFTAPPGLTVLFGRSGAGKSTLVRALAGLSRVDRGRLVAGGRVLLDTARGVLSPPHRRQVGVVFQDGLLLPHLSVRGNLDYGARRAGGRPAPVPFDELIERLGIGALLARSPATLSGGERQRVALARALLASPRLLLMDEPLAALDGPRRAELLGMIERLRDRAGIPIVHVTHSVAEMARLATTVVVLGEGRVLASGPVRAMLADPALAPLIGVRETGAILPARIVAHHADGLSELAAGGGRLWLPRLDLPEGSAIALRVLAHDVMIALTPPQGLSALNVLPARIEALREGQGPGVIAVLDCGEGERLLARVTRRSADALGLKPGLHCHAVIKATAVAPGDVGAPQ